MGTQRACVDRQQASLGVGLAQLVCYLGQS
jgi:hypothetical protein